MAKKGEAVKRLHENDDGAFDISPDDVEAFRKLQEEIRSDSKHHPGDRNGGQKGS